jgi:hypothetical protein
VTSSPNDNDNNLLHNLLRSRGSTRLDGNTLGTGIIQIKGCEVKFLLEVMAQDISGTNPVVGVIALCVVEVLSEPDYDRRMGIGTEVDCVGYGAEHTQGYAGAIRWNNLRH